MSVNQVGNDPGAEVWERIIRSLEGVTCPRCGSRYLVVQGRCEFYYEAEVAPGVETEPRLVEEVDRTVDQVRCARCAEPLKVPV